LSQAFIMTSFCRVHLRRMGIKWARNAFLFLTSKYTRLRLFFKKGTREQGAVNKDDIYLSILM